MTAADTTKPQPIRVQRKRSKGWRMPPNTVSVTRPGKWGNPFEMDTPKMVRDGDRETVIRKFEETTLPTLDLRPLRGKNLACYCALDAMCHADILLREANKPVPGQSALIQMGANHNE